MDKLYYTLVSRLRWSIRDIDESDFEALMDFLFFCDPDERVIDGVTYRRCRSAPDWL